MTFEHQRFVRPVLAGVSGVFLLALLSAADAQDVRGLEVCTAEKQMERRTGCLQANVEFLHQALTKLERDTREKINALTRDLAASRAEIATLKSTVAKLDSEPEASFSEITDAFRRVSELRTHVEGLGALLAALETRAHEVRATWRRQYVDLGVSPTQLERS